MYILTKKNIWCLNRFTKSAKNHPSFKGDSKKRKIQIYYFLLGTTLTKISLMTCPFSICVNDVNFVMWYFLLSRKYL